MKQPNSSLLVAAYTLAEEIRDGRWQHISDLSTKPVTDSTELIEELQRRCPGFSRSEYRRALANGMFVSR